MQQSGTTKQPSVHFSGIGGTGMVAGARLAVEAGWEVRGSDTPLYPPTSEMVAQLGVPVATQYAAENLDWNPDLVVVGNALSRGNPEVEAALERRMRYVSLPEWIKDHVLRARRPVAICGTHGKTTTTALAAFILDHSGLAPGFLIGGQPADFAHSSRLGATGAPFVIEGDEYDTAFFDKRAKFLHYLPEIAVVTSMEFDHGDIYANLAEIETAFQRMLRQIPRTGWLIACADNAAASLRAHAPCQVTTYGFAPTAEWRGELLHDANGFQRVRVHRGALRWADLETPLAGQHNVQNLLASVAVAATLGAGPKEVAEAVRAFRGVRRRMEVFLEAAGTTFVDDFAHHPTAIRETIRAARSRWPGRRLRVLAEPRSNTMVTRRFQAELTGAFGEADEVWLGPVYRADRIDPGDRLDRAAIVGALEARGIPCHACHAVEDIFNGVCASLVAGDVVLMLSNGAFGGIYRQFREKFVS